MSAQQNSKAPERYHIAVVGAGRMGQVRLASMLLNPRVRIAGIVDADHDRATEAATRFSTQPFDDLTQALSQDNLDAVWIATSTPSHRSIIEAANCSVARLIGVEKPVGTNPTDIQACYTAVKASGKHLLCSFQRRFDRHFQAAADAVRNGSIGTPLSVHAIFRDHPLPSREFLKTGGDPFHDLAVHDIDYVCSVIPGDIVEVVAYANSSNPELAAMGVFDNATCVALFDTGVRLTMDLSRGSCYGYDQRVEFFGTKGVAAVENVQEQSAVIGDVDGFRRSITVGQFHQRFAAAFSEELEEMIRILDGEARPAVSVEAACKTTIVAEAMRLSAIERQQIRICYDSSEIGRAKYQRSYPSSLAYPREVTSEDW